MAASVRPLRSGAAQPWSGGSLRLDVVGFRELVEVAEACIAEQRHEPALDRYVQALGLWHPLRRDGRGPAKRRPDAYANAR